MYVILNTDGPDHPMNVQAKKGIASGTKEDSYHSPANDEAAIYGELKKLNIPNISGFKLE